MSADEVVAMLRRHYLPEGRPAAGLFASEVGSPCGARRADALWMPLTEHGGGLVGHEVKVTRADVLTELADPTKADAWSRYCERWWLTVSDPSLVDGLTIPEQWGVMAPPSGRRTRSMTVLRPAPKLKPVSPAPAFRRLLSWYFSRAENQVAAAQGEGRRLRADVERARAESRQLRLAGGGAPSPHAQRVNAIVAEVERRKGEQRIHLGAVDDELVVAAIVDAEATRVANQTARYELQSLIRDVERAVEPLKGARRDLERAQKKAGGAR